MTRVSPTTPTDRAQAGPWALVSPRAIALASRLARAAAVSFGVLTIAFLLIRLVPGDPATVLCDLCSPEDIAEFRRQLGLDGSLIEQYASYLGGVLAGDLGQSIRSARPVVEIILERLPVSVGLVSLTLLFTTVVSVPLALAGAAHRDTWIGHGLRVLTAALVAIPVFFSGVVAILVVAVELHAAPVGGYEPGLPHALRYLWLPAAVMTVAIAPVVTRLLQQSIIETDGEEFVDAAVARGLPRVNVLVRYLLRPSLGPTIALLGYITGALIGSAVMVELVFNLPGMGYTLIDAVLQRDYPVVQGLVLVSGVAVVVVNVVADLLAGAIDPRLGAPST